jgi:hypothetical protein
LRKRGQCPEFLACVMGFFPQRCLSRGLGVFGDEEQDGCERAAKRLQTEPPPRYSHLKMGLLVRNSPLLVADKMLQIKPSSVRSLGATAAEQIRRFHPVSILTALKPSNACITPCLPNQVQTLWLWLCRTGGRC